MLRFLAAGALMMAAVVSAEPVVVEVGGFVTLQRMTADQVRIRFDFTEEAAD